MAGWLRLVWAPIGQENRTRNPMARYVQWQANDVQEIADDGIVAVDKYLKQSKIQADTVVLAVGLEPDAQLYKLLLGKVANLYALGDCQEPRRIMGAIWDSYEVARSI